MQDKRREDETKQNTIREETGR